MSLKAPAVVRQIGSRPLYLGSSRAAHEGVASVSFEAVLTLGPAAQPLTTHHHPLTDGQGLEHRRFEEAVETALRVYREGGPVLVQCQAGISRSAAVVATVLAIEEEQTFEEAMENVKATRERASPRRELRTAARRLLRARSRGRLAAE